jgi:hypothetical protein
MPVFIVALTAPNGNRVSRPIVASCACHAVDYMKAAHDVSEHDQSFQVDVMERSDPDGQYEQLLKDAEMRRERDEVWDRR